jgi:hypothetical protein
VTNLFLRIFLAANKRSALENIDQSEKVFLKRISKSFSKLVSNFKEAKKKLVIDLENNQCKQIQYRKY